MTVVNAFTLLQFDAEIVFWEGKTREQQHQVDFLAQEAARIEVAARLGEEQVCLPVSA
jgi:Ras association domain-containing protein 7/8